MIQDCLVIDDDQDDQEIFVMCLNAIDSNIRCTTASDPVEAVAMLGANTDYTPQYIFIDVNMPKMNGLDCLRMLKSMERLANAQMFMYSTSVESNILEQSKDLGAIEYIIKPTKTKELTEKLAKIFESGFEAAK